MAKIWVVYTVDIDNGSVNHIGAWPTREVATQEVKEILLRELEEDKESYLEDVEDAGLEDTPELRLEKIMDGWTPGYITKKIPAHRTKSGVVKPARSIKTPKEIEFDWGIFT